MFVDELGHLEHRHLVLTAEHWAELVVRVDHPAFLLVLTAVALDVLPDLFRDLGARHRSVTDYCAERCIWLHRLHERRIRRSLRARALAAAGFACTATRLLRAA